MTHGYDVLEELCSTDLDVLSRGRRREDGAAVLLKIPRRTPPTAQDCERLDREHELMRGLDLDGVARPLELVRRDGVCLLALEDRGGLPLAALIRSGRPDRASFFRLSIRMAALLSQLHRRDVVLRRLTPAGLMVGPAGGAVSLVDLGLAARGAAAGGLPAPAESPAGSLAYLSPEMTGRMNRAVDYRTDLYTLGVLMYEMLTGSPPFLSDDALELIHWHIARTPPAPHHVDPSIPGPVSSIVCRLLAKTAEERYQSAAGLAEDLEICEREWAERGTVGAFPLGGRDVPERFVVSQTLYGRSREVEVLQSVLDSVCEGPSALALVAGYAGIGKTSLIQELYRPIVRRRGAFAAGKLDQVVRNTPYGALIQAIRRLVQQLLAQSEDSGALWRSRLAEALGPGAGVITEVVPEAELLLGAQPQPRALGSAEAQNRFQLAFQNFVGALARRDHPLVIFLDDLQWVDAATLGLLAPLLTSPDVRHLLIIGAYRDNEVDESHPLRRTLRALASAGARIHAIELGPLRPSELVTLLQDTLRAGAPEIEALADLVMRKTAGNPFFVTQFLKSLNQRGFIEFEPGARRWRVRMNEILGAAMTDNVIDLMTQKLRRLSPRTQRVLTLAACVGGEFGLDVLAVASGEEPARIASDLRDALEQGLILPVQEGAGAAAAVPASSAAPRYAFLHDRVQQAAYDLVAEDERPALHLGIGRLLRDRLGQAAADERIFDVASHLNLGRALIADPAERLALAGLDLAAGRRAKSAAAFREALAYLRAGRSLLEERHWESDYDLVMALHTEAAECTYLCGDFDESERAFGLLLSRARTRIEQARVRCLMTQQYEHVSRCGDAVRAAREGLALFGLALPAAAEQTRAALDAEQRAIDRLLAGRRIEDLVGLPAAQDPEFRAMMGLLTTVWAPAYVSGDAVLTRLISAMMVRLSLEHGNTEESAYGYVTHAITVGPVGGDYRSAYEWGQLALSVNERFDDRRLRAKIHQQFNAHVNLWRRPLATCIPHARKACLCGLETGDFTYAGYGAFTEAWAALLTCRDLERFVDEHARSLALLEKIRMAGLCDAQRVVLNFAQALRGRTRDRLSLDDDGFSERDYLAAHADQPFFLTFLHVLKLYLYVLFDEREEALVQLAHARRVAPALDGTIWPVLLGFLEGLTLSATAGPDQDASGPATAALEEIAARMSRLAADSPENFRGFALVLEAELRRLQGSRHEAQRLHEEALRHARETEGLLVEALAAELCARCCRRAGEPLQAARYLRVAHDLYGRWGAAAKARDLEARHPDLFPAAARASGAGAAGPDGATPPATAGGEGVALDVATFAKAASAVAMEIVQDDLLRKLVRIAIENAGAQRGLFLREQDGALVLEASGGVDQEEVSLERSAPVPEGADLCRAVLQYVRRTGQSLVVADASEDDRFSSDPYVLRARPRSILCVPILHQGRTSGILYLENNLTADAFTEDRVRVLRILSSQAAIALENARLYEEMRQEVARRRRAEEDLRAALEEVRTLKDRLQAENVYLQEEIRGEHNFEEMVGGTPGLLDLLAKVERVAPTDTTVLVWGETGTGKELIARALHSRSARRDRPLTKVNCGAIAPALVESEMFGHVKGAFTGALERRVGRFELADGGTLFLDEVGELPLETQVKLLRVLQEQEFEPVGSSRSVRVDVRVIAATNRDLEAEVKAGRFRADLFYRLSVFPLRVPPLRERGDDLPQLVMFFLARFNKKFGKRVEGVSQETMRRLAAYSWPGNIRELQNVVERAVVLSRSPVLSLGPDLLPVREAAGSDRDAATEGSAPAAAAPVSAASGGSGEPAALQDVERGHIKAVLLRTGGVIEGPRGAAKILDLHPNTLRSRMKKLGISRTGHDIS